MLRAQDKLRYLRLPRIPNAEVQLLWHVAYYDLPLEGVAEWNGQKYWFDTIGEEIPEQKEFFLVRLPESEMKKAEEIQRLRESMYGCGNRHDSGHSERWSGLKGDAWMRGYEESQRLFQAFVEASRQIPQPDFATGEVVGWSFWKEPEAEANQRVEPTPLTRPEI